MRIFEPVKINKMTAKNKIMMPPCVLFGINVPDGEVGDFRLEHYEERAKQGVGTVVVEAAAVNKDYLITRGQVGIWDDAQIAGLSELAERINKHGAISVIQIQHAGGKPLKEVNDSPIGPSAMEYAGHNMREASKAELEQVCEQFIAAAVRAKKAGFHGVEIHNAHGYLLTQMVSPLINKREDEYGGTPEKRMKLSLDILKGIRKACGDDFIIGVRFGANEPDYNDGVFIAQKYEEKYLKLTEVCDEQVRKTLAGIYYSWARMRFAMGITDDCYDFDFYFEKLSKCFPNPVDPGNYTSPSPGAWICMVGSSRKGALQEFIAALERTVSHL